ncbi:MAG: hypothetical protein WCI65_12940 [Synechococcaceae cyanobacterium ELA263]|jgi:hypothetical protein
MRRDATGHYELTSTAGKTVRAFVPAPSVTIDAVLNRFGRERLL